MSAYLSVAKVAAWVESLLIDTDLEIKVSTDGRHYTVEDGAPNYIPKKVWAAYEDALFLQGVINNTDPNQSAIEDEFGIPDNTTWIGTAVHGGVDFDDKINYQSEEDTVTHPLVTTTAAMNKAHEAQLAAEAIVKAHQDAIQQEMAENYTPEEPDLGPYNKQEAPIILKEDTMTTTTTEPVVVSGAEFFNRQGPNTPKEETMTTNNVENDAEHAAYLQSLGTATKTPTTTTTEETKVTTTTTTDRPEGAITHKCEQGWHMTADECRACAGAPDAPSKKFQQIEGQKTLFQDTKEEMQAKLASLATNPNWDFVRAGECKGKKGGFFVTAKKV